MLNATLLGTGGTIPLKNRWLSSCLISVNGHSVLVDCGEGTQIALKIAGHKFKPIDTICITHFHADHISGLPGLLLTMGNEGRTEPVKIFGPVGLKNIVNALCVIVPVLSFALEVHELKERKEFHSDKLIITPFQAEHSVDCIGYSFYLPHDRKFEPDKARNNQVPIKLWSTLQKGQTAELDGTIYTPDMVLGAERRGIKLTYCTDSRPTEGIKAAAQKSDLFICEGMYDTDDKLPQAKEKGHMLFSEAARLAKAAKAERLIFTHYSPSLDEPENGLENARKIFPNTECGYDGQKIALSYRD